MVHCDMDKAAQIIGRRSSLKREEIRERLFDQEMIDAWDIGELDAMAFTERVQEACDWDGTSEELEQIWQEMLVPDPEMFVVFDELVRSGHRIYILSNANPFHTEFVLNEHPALRQAEGYVFSCECRMIKPQIEIFHHLTEKFSLDPGHSIFIDDKLPNIKAAERAGYYAIHHSAAETTRLLLAGLIEKLVALRSS